MERPATSDGIQHMVDIEYIGHKPVKTDNVSGSGAVWAGAGDIQQVAQEQADKLLKFPGVWRLAGGAELHVDDAAVAASTQVAQAQEIEQEQPDGGEEESQAQQSEPANDKAALLAVAHGMGIKVDGRSSPAKILALIDQRRAELAGGAELQGE